MAQRYKFSIESKSFPLDISGEPKAAKLFLFQPSRHPTVRVRRPIGFRSPSDQIPSAVRSDSVRRTMTIVETLQHISAVIRSLFPHV